MIKRYSAYILLIAACGFLFFYRLGTSPLLGMDEGLYVETSREMLVSGNFITPEYNGNIFFDKPPLIYWLQAESMRLFGINSFAARVPSAVAGILLVGFVAFLGTRIYGRKAGVLSGIAMIASLLATGLARLAIIDQLFALLIALSLGAFLLSYLKLWPKAGYLVFWAAAGLSVITKGPAGAVLIFATIFIFLVIRRDLKAIAGTIPLAGIPVFILIAAPWYVLVQKATGGKFLEEFIIHQNLDRAAGKSFGHNQTGIMYILFYPLIFLVGFFPWSIFMPLAWKKQVRIQAKGTQEIASLFMGVWILTITLIFTASVSKLPGYIYPIFPASALLVGAMFSGAEARDSSSLRKCSITTVIFAVLLAVGMLAGQTKLKTPIPGVSSALIPMESALVIGTVSALVLFSKKRITAAFGMLTAGIAVFLLAAVGIGLPIAGHALSRDMVLISKDLARVSSHKTNAYVFMISPPQPAISFYAQHPVPEKKTSEELGKAIRTGTSFVVTQENAVNELPNGGQLISRRGKYLLYRFSEKSD